MPKKLNFVVPFQHVYAEWKSSKRFGEPSNLPEQEYNYYKPPKSPRFIRYFEVENLNKPSQTIITTEEINHVFKKFK